MKGLISLDDKPVLDLNHVHFQHIHGAILILGSWYMDNQTRQSQPCLVLLDAARKVQRRRTVPCVVLLDDMWRWAAHPHLGLSDPEHVSRCIHDWLSSGALPGNPGNKKDVFAVMDAVQSRLRDLVAMPPMPIKAAVKHGAVPVGNLTITERDTGKTVDQIEVFSSHVRN